MESGEKGEVNVEMGEVVIVVEIRRSVCLLEVPIEDPVGKKGVVETQKLGCSDENRVGAEGATSPARGLMDVEVGIGSVAVPAGPCCAAALPATDAVVVVVLYMLVVPVCRPA